MQHPADRWFCRLACFLSSLGAGVLLISAAFYTLRVSARHKLHKMSGTQDRHALV
jgi:hypothetical protein